MKYCIILILFTAPLSAQSFLKNFYFSFDAKEKYEFYTIPDRQQYVEIEPYNDHYAWFNSDGARWDAMVKYWLIGYRITPKLEVEIGQTQELYMGGFKYHSPYFPYEDHQTAQGVDHARNYIIRLTRKFFPLEKLSLNASIAYTLSKSGYWNGIIPINFSIPDRSLVDTSMVFYSFTHQEHRVDLGLKKYHHAIEGRATLEYQPFKLFSIYYGWGLTKGFNTFAHQRVTYWINDGPKQTSIALVKGSNYFWCFGFKVFPFELGKKDRDSRG